MTHQDRHPLPLDTARECFALLVSGPQPLSLDGRAFHGLPQRPIPLDELRGLLLRHSCPRLTRDAVWTHLVRRSRREGATWTLACTGMALPALAGVVKRLAGRFPGDPFDIHSEVLSGFLGALATADVARPRVLPRLRWAAYRQGFAALMAALDAPTPVAPGFRSTPPQPPWGHPDLVLARAVRESVLTVAEADLIGATRLDGTGVADWAAQRNTTPNAAYKLRRRAEARLIAFLRDESQDASFDDPVALRIAEEVPSRLVFPSRRDTGPELSRPPSTQRSAEKPPHSVAKNGSDSGLLKCGESMTASQSPLPPEVY